MVRRCPSEFLEFLGFATTRRATRGLDFIEAQRGESRAVNGQQASEIGAHSHAYAGTFIGKVWLDDVRPAPAGWVHVLTPEAIDLLRSGDVEEISLDHDLGLFTEGGKEHTGHEVLVFIEREVAMGTATFTLPEIHIHSANAVGRRRMTQAIQSIKRLSGE
jgi:hypothetical protein